MYTIAEVLPITKQVKLIGKKNFATVVFDLEDEAFVVHIIFISQDSNVYSS